jgi:hypothetical protein
VCAASCQTRTPLPCALLLTANTAVCIPLVIRARLPTSRINLSGRAIGRIAQSDFWRRNHWSILCVKISAPHLVYERTHGGNIWDCGKNHCLPAGGCWSGELDRIAAHDGLQHPHGIEGPDSPLILVYGERLVLGTCPPSPSGSLIHSEGERRKTPSLLAGYSTLRSPYTPRRVFGD